MNEEEALARLEPLLGRVVSPYTKQNPELHEDLLSEARLGALEAIRAFDPDIGATLETFAYTRARSRVRHYVRDKESLVRVPSRMHDRGIRVSIGGLDDNMIADDHREGPDMLRVEMVVRKNGTIWMTQDAIAELLGKSQQAVERHLRRLVARGAIYNTLSGVSKKGKKTRMRHYPLPVVLEIAFRSRSERAARFRMWAARQLAKSFLNLRSG